jgi:hypothetical protein
MGSVVKPILCVSAHTNAGQNDPSQKTPTVAEFISEARRAFACTMVIGKR